LRLRRIPFTFLFKARSCRGGPCQFFSRSEPVGDFCSFPPFTSFCFHEPAVFLFDGPSLPAFFASRLGLLFLCFFLLLTRADGDSSSPLSFLLDYCLLLEFLAERVAVFSALFFFLLLVLPSPRSALRPCWIDLLFFIGQVGRFSLLLPREGPVFLSFSLRQFLFPPCLREDATTSQVRRPCFGT